MKRRRLGSVVAGVLATARRRGVARRYLQPAEAYLAAGRIEEAEALVGTALQEHPGDAELLIVSAKTAVRAGTLGPAIERWEAALAAAPERWSCHVGLAGTLRLAGDTARATARIATAQARFPEEPTVIGEAARIAEARADFADALELWQRLTAIPPAHPLWQGAEARALILLDRLDEAEVVLAAAEQGAHPNDPLQAEYLLGIRGRLLSARKDWGGAVPFWKAFQERFPQNPQSWRHLGYAIENLAFAEAERTSAEIGPTLGVEQLAAIDVVENSDAHRLLSGFESIGRGCEFGLVQRRFGAEPLSLLRWNAAPMSAVVAALECDLQGLGAPENTRLTLLPNGEYVVSDTRWGLAMHTWLFRGQVEEETLLAKMCRRIAFLKDKILADAAGAEKIFLHHSDVIEMDEFERLHGHLRRHGPVRLLGVQPANGRAHVGEVVQVGERRYIGFIERFGRREDGSWDIRFEDWLAVCRAAADLAAAPGEGRRTPEELDIHVPSGS